MYLHIILVMMLLAWPSHSPAGGLDPSQSRVVMKALRMGVLIGHPETIAAIVLTESSAGRGGRIGDNGNSFGIMQVQLPTARHVAVMYPWLKLPQQEDELALKLLDDNYSLLIGSLYFKMCMDTFKEWKRAVVCYNRGPTGAVHANLATNKYLKKVQQNLNLVRRLYGNTAFQRPRATMPLLPSKQNGQGLHGVVRSSTSSLWQAHARDISL